MKDKKRKYRFLRRSARVLGVLFLFVIALVLFIRSPWGQNIIVSKAVNYVTERTNTKIEIDRLFITFSGNLFLEGLYLEDKKGDTLVYSKTLEANIELSPLIFGNSFNLESAEWEGLTANISRNEGSEKFNFDFLLEALVPADTITTSTNSKPMQISIGSLDFENFNIDYNDNFLGIEASTRLGKLRLEANKTNLDSLRFDLENLKLSDTDIVYTQTKPLVTGDTTQTQLPFFSVGNLQIENVKANYNSIPDSILANVDIGSFLLELPKANLIKNDIEIDLLSLKNTSLVLQLPSPNTEKDSTQTVLASSSFEWPDFLIKADDMVFENNSVSYNSGETESIKGKLNPNAFAFSDLTMMANNLEYHPENFQLNLDGFSFKEKSGFRLQKLAFDSHITDTAAKLSSLQLKTKSSMVQGNLSAKYQSVQQLIDAPEDSSVDVQLPDLQLSLQDAFFFQPELAQNEYLKKAAQYPLAGKLRAQGTLETIQIQNMDLKWGVNTSVIAAGSLQNATELDSLGFEFDTLKLVSKREDVLKFVDEKDLGITVPKNILVTAEAKGNLNNMAADVRLEIPEGSINVNGNYQNQTEIAFDGNVKVDSLQLDKLLNNEQLGAISFTMNVAGSGTSLNTLNAELKSDFSQLNLMDYNFSNLELQGNIENGKGDIGLAFKDNNLNLKAKSKVNLDNITSKIGLDLNVIGADLNALGITKENIKAGLEMRADFKGNSNDFELKAQIENGIAVYDNQQYQMGQIDLTTAIDSLSTDMRIESDFLQGSLSSNASPNGINEALTQQFKNYFRDSTNTNSATDSVALKMDVRLFPNPILTEVFFRDVERLDSISVRADFDARTKLLNAELYVPTAKYGGIAIDSLNVLIEGDATDLNFTAGLSAINAEPVNVKKTYFEGKLQNKQLLLDFNSYDDKERVAHIASEMTLAKDTVLLHINPAELTFNRKEWTIPKNNQISMAENFLAFTNIKLSRNAQELNLSNSMPGVENDHIGIRFDNFRLQTFASLLNPDEALVSGLVAGDFIIENPFGATGLVADFKIDALEVLENPLGNLSLDATSTGSSSYDFNLALKDGGADLDVTGDYTAAATGAKLNLDMDLNRIELKVIERFSNGTIEDGNGYLSGEIDLSGSTASPEYKGTINFNAVDFNVAALNAVFKISEETLKIDTNGVYLDTFQIADADGSEFTLNGSILTESLLNPSFDLTLDTEKFRVLNSTKEDNELFYGTASLDADVTVKGDLELPKVEGKLRIRDVTNITYVVPESQLDVEERDGVVIFVNRENPDAILTRNDQEETPAFFQGFDVRAVLEIADDADFKVIIDERTGDNLEISGDAALNLNIEPNGRINLSGRYELNSGHYETSLYNLVNRRFEINLGSTITWQGDPMDAKLDITAIYELETSASPLMSSVTSGQDISVSSQYRQVLPFMVYLNVDGELLEPELSFALDMPEDEQGSLGGAVYGRVQQLNQQEAELNKQVFSLLALNRFYPDSGSDGSTGGTAAIARDNVNKVLSGEINAFSDKILGNTGFEVDFDLDSFTDYQGESPQDRTQLNINAKKKLFDDRLIVTAGSAVDVEGSAQPGQEETPIIGNVSLEYLLTKDGRYRLRGFRKSEYENIIDGQLIVTGLALIFNREFNKFSQLFNPLKNRSKKEQKPAEDLKNTENK